MIKGTLRHPTPPRGSRRPRAGGDVGGDSAPEDEKENQKKNIIGMVEMGGEVGKVRLGFTVEI